MPKYNIIKINVYIELIVSISTEITRNYVKWKQSLRSVLLQHRSFQLSWRKISVAVKLYDMFRPTTVVSRQREVKDASMDLVFYPIVNGEHSVWMGGAFYWGSLEL
jgi:hypothetical protein